MPYRWDFTSVLANWPALAVGALGTLRIFAICLVLGLGLGLIVGLGRYARRRVLYYPATAFVEFFRNTPVLVQILWFYFALPILVPVEISPLAAAALGISLNSAAFSADLFRGGIQSIEPGQSDGVPALTNRAIEIFKMSTLASVVAYVELLHQGQLIASLHFNPIETYSVIAIAFFLFLYPLVRATYAIERRLASGD